MSLSFLEECEFRDGYIGGSIAKHAKSIDTEDGCAVYVKQKYPSASGATWYRNSSCWAEFGIGFEFVLSSAHRTCLLGNAALRGKVFYVIPKIKQNLQK